MFYAVETGDCIEKVNSQVRATVNNISLDYLNPMVTMKVKNRIAKPAIDRIEEIIDQNSFQSKGRAGHGKQAYTAPDIAHPATTPDRRQNQADIESLPLDIRQLRRSKRLRIQVCQPVQGRLDCPLVHLSHPIIYIN